MPADAERAVVALREVDQADLETFYANQLDSEARRMADFPARDREAYMALWGRILATDEIVKRTILCDGAVAGNIVSFPDDQGMREVGYWISREFWGKGIATQALTMLLAIVTDRPLLGHTVIGNAASRRVLEKCGFIVTARDDKEYTLRLDDSPQRPTT